MGQPATLRSLNRDDIADMAKLHTKGFDQPWLDADMAEHIARDICIGIGVPLAGFVIIRQSGDQAEILTITVSPDRQKRGLGMHLLDSGHAFAARAGADIIFLEVAEDNRAAIALYRRAGYTPIGRRPAYYKRAQGRVAALTFRKLLDASQPKR